MSLHECITLFTKLHFSGPQISQTSTSRLKILCDMKKIPQTGAHKHQNLIAWATSIPHLCIPALLQLTCVCFQFWPPCASADVQHDSRT